MCQDEIVEKKFKTILPWHIFNLGKTVRSIFFSRLRNDDETYGDFEEMAKF